MKTIAIIPARGGSKGIPNKALIWLSDKPLIQWSIEQAQRAESIDDVWVTSDSAAILKVANITGARIIKRPDEFATDTATTESALKHAVKSIGWTDTLVVLLQPTSPLRLTDDIDNMIKQFEEKKLDSMFSATPSEDTFIWDLIDDKPVSINYDYKDRKRRQDLKKQFIENGSIYIFKPEILLEHNNRLGGKIGIYVMKSWQGIEIDTYDDLELCEFYMRRHVL